MCDRGPFALCDLWRSRAGIVLTADDYVTYRAQLPANVQEIMHTDDASLEVGASVQTLHV